MATDKEQIIVEVTYDTDDAQKSVNALTDDIIGLEQANKDLKDQLKKGEISQADYSKAVEANRTTLAKNKAERKDNIKFLQAEEKSQDKLQKQVKLLTNARKKLNLETKEGQDKAEDLNRQIDELRETTNDYNSTLEQNKNNIGNYKEDVKAALAETDLFNGGIEGMISGLTGAGEAGGAAESGLGGMAKGLGGITKAALKFILTPIGAIIAAIVVGVKLLTEALKRNEGVTDKFSEVFEGLSAVFEAVIGRIQKLVNIAGKLFKGQISLTEAVEEGSHAFDGMGESIKTAYDEGVKLKKMQTDMEKAAIKNTTALAALNAEYEKQSAIADDDTLSLAKMAEASALAAAAAKAAGEIEVTAARAVAEEVALRVKMAKENQSLTRALEQEQADAIAAQIEAESRLTLTLYENGVKRRQIARDVFEQELDFIIDVTDARKTSNEKIINDEKKLFSQRVEILAATDKIVNESFEQQVALIEEQGEIAIDTNKLLTLNNEQAAEYAFSLGLSEIATNRLLEVIRERIAATSDLAEAEELISERRREIHEFQVEEDDEELNAIYEATNAELERANATFENNEAIAESNKEKNKKLKDDDKKSAEERAAIALALANITLSTFSALVDEKSRRNQEALDRDIAAQDIALNDELLAEQNALNQSLANEGLTEQQRNVLIAESQLRQDQIITDSEEEKARVKLEYAKKQQKLDLAQAISAGALAVLNALSTVPFIPVGVAAGVSAGTLTAVQINTIKNREFAEGGNVTSGTFGGKYHSQGGNNLYDSSGNLVANVERDENFYVMKRDASAHINALSSINEQFGGNSFGGGNVSHAANGGQINTQQTQQAGLTASDVSKIIENTPIIVEVSSIMAGLNAEQSAINVGVA